MPYGCQMSPAREGSASFDWASHAPLHPAARAAFEAALDAHWGDPARLHHSGRQARQALELARQSVAANLGARADEVYFLPSGTAAIHAGIAGLLGGRRRVGHRVLASAVEHSAVLNALNFHAADVTLAPVDVTGRVLPEELERLVETATAFVAVQSANHEVGTLQPLRQVRAACEVGSIPLMVDASVTLPWSAPDFDWDVLVGSAHKWGGPAGVGVLVVRTGTRFRSPFPEDERGWGNSPGFENVAGIVAAAAALQAVRQEVEVEARVRSMTARLRAALPHLVSDCVVLGSADERAPHIVTASLLYVDGEAMLTALDRHGIAASSGSSCTSSTLTPSHVLAAMGVLTHGNLRLSIGRTTTDADIDHLLGVLPDVVTSIRTELGAGEL